MLEIYHLTRIALLFSLAILSTGLSLPPSLDFDRNSTLPPWVTHEYQPRLTSCSDDVSEYCFITGDREMNWSQAHSYCRSQGGFLPENKELQVLGNLRVISNLTWSSLAYVSHCHQWVSRFPAYAPFIDWEQGHKPPPWDSNCPVFNSEARQFRTTDCSHKYDFACIISAHEETQNVDFSSLNLTVISSTHDRSGWINVNANEFHNLNLQCQPTKNKNNEFGSSHKTLQLNTHWIKDGIWISNNKPSIEPATTFDSYKNSLLPFSTSLETSRAINQGTYCCETWMPFSAMRKISNCFLVTLKEWTSMIVTHRVAHNDTKNLDYNDVILNLEPLFINYFGNDSDLVYAPIGVLKYTNASSGYEDVSYEYKFNLFSQKLTSKLMSNLSQLNDQIKKEIKSDSTISLATYCKETSMNFGYGNIIPYPFVEAGHRYQTEMKCELKNNTVHHPVCQWDFIHGAKIVFSKNCLRNDVCPQEFCIIAGQVCLKILRNVTWETGFDHFYKLGIETTLFESKDYFTGESSAIHTNIVKYLLDSGVTNTWLLFKRRYPKTPLINLRKSAVSPSINLNAIKNSGKWRKGHPIADHQCAGFELHTNEYYSSECNMKNNFVIIINPSNDIRSFETPPSSSYGHKLENSEENIYFSICQNGWNRLPTLDGSHVCLKTFSYNSTWEMANSFCKLRGANLISPQKGFRNWCYKHIVGNHYTWINIKNVNNSITRVKYDYINWLPETNFSSQYGIMTNKGWFLANNGRRSSNVICEFKNNKTKTSNIVLEKDKNEKHLCIKIFNNIANGTIQCLLNGTPIKYDYSDDINCLLTITLNSQGYYECYAWSLQTNIIIRSNTFHYINDSLNTFIVRGFDSKTSYKPKDYDSTFMTSKSTSRFENDCMRTIYEYLLNKKEWMKISEVLFFDVNNKLTYSFMLECQNNIQNICASKNDVFMNIKQMLKNSTYKDRCAIEEVRSSVGCLSESSEDKYDSNKIVSWPNTKGAGKILPKNICIDIEGKLITRKCYGNFITGYYWSPSPRGCPGIPSNRTTNIWKICEDTQGYMQGKYNALSKLTEDSESLVPADFHYVARSLENISKNPNSSNQIEFEDIVLTMNNIIKVTNETFNFIYEHFNSSAVLLDSFEKLAFQIDAKDNMTGVKHSFQDEILADCVDVSKNKSIIGFKSDKKSGNLLLKNNFNLDEAEVAIVLPNKLTYNIVNANNNKAVTMQTKTQLLFVIYKRDQIFFDQERNSSGFKVNSQIIQATYENKTIKNLSDGVKIYYRPKYKGGEVVCVYWDTKRNKRKGGWSEYGCRLISNNGTLTTCECNHLSIFSLLIRYDDELMNNMNYLHKKMLGLISVIGCVLSITGLTLVLTTFITLRKWRKSLSNQILANLSLAILCSLLIFLTGIEHTWNAYICRSVAVSLHYFISVSFAWMLVEGVHQYLRFVKVVGTYIPRFLWKASVCAWGIPIIPVIAILVIDSDLYEDGSESDICWMTPDIFVYVFVPSVSLILFINAVLFAMIIDNVIIRRKSINSTLQNREMIIGQLSMAICIFLLLGFTWVFGLLAISSGALVFSYLFCICNTLQGFFIFIFHLCRDRSARRLWRGFLGGSSNNYPSGKFASFSRAHSLGSQAARSGEDTIPKFLKRQDSRRFHSRKSKLYPSTKTTPT